MRLRRALAPNGPLLMRFDGRRPTVEVKDVHETLKPRSLPADYTPFPLPRYDASLGFGPTRLQNIPDVARAKLSLMEEVRRTQDTAEEVVEASLLDSMSSDASSMSAQPGNASVAARCSEKGSPSYVQQEGFPLLDRLVCNRSMGDLLRQFKEHPGVEGKAAAINDIASSLARFTNEELCLMFDELASTFDPDGKGMNFLARRIQGYQTAFWVSSSLHWAFTGLVEDIEAHVLSTMSNGEKNRIGDPSVLIGMLTLFAKAKVFEPNLWHSRCSIQPSSMGSSPNPKRHNKHHASRDLFVELFDALQDCIVSCSPAPFAAGSGSGTQEAMPTPFLSCFNPTGLAELFAALSAVHPEGIVAGGVANEILNHFIALVEDGKKDVAPNSIDSKELDLAVGRMCLATTMANITNARLDDLADECSVLSTDMLIALSRRRPLPLPLVERRVREAVNTALDPAVPDGDGLLQGACELLQAMENKEAAVRLSMETGLGAQMLLHVPYFAGVSEMLKTCRSDCPDDSAMAGARGRTKSKRLFTYQTSLVKLRALTSVTIAHTSVMTSDIAPLIHACHQLRTGRVGLLVCTQTILSLSRLAHSSSKKSVRALSMRALQILASEIRKGRVCLVPIEDELDIRDSAHFADEDVMVWSIAAKMVHDAPMTKVRMLVRRGHEASAPYHTLKRGSYGRFTQTHFLLNMGAAIKGSQVGMSPLSLNFSSRELVNQARPINTLGKVRDQPSRVGAYNPRRAHLAYRRDRPLFDKYRPHARNNAPGFGRGGATDHDLRGLGIHTPDHPQAAGQLPCVAAD